MSKDVKHRGRVLDVSDGVVLVSIISESACSSCKVKGSCAMSETQEKVVDVITEHSSYFSVGEEVEVSIKQVMGMKAVLYVYILPFLCVFGSLIVFVSSGLGDGLSGLLSLGILIIYYICLYFFRKRINKEISFQILKLF